MSYKNIESIKSQLEHWYRNELKAHCFMTLCYYYVTYAFQSESTLYICLNDKELLARNRCNIWSLSDYNGTRTHSQPDSQNWHPNCLSVRLRTKWLWVRGCFIYICYKTSLILSSFYFFHDGGLHDIEPVHWFAVQINELVSISYRPPSWKS